MSPYPWDSGFLILCEALYPIKLISVAKDGLAQKHNCYFAE